MADEQIESSVVEMTDLDDRMRALEDAEYAVERAFATGKADRAAITSLARDSALEAAEEVGFAIDADAEADEAARFAIIAEGSNDREKTKAARLNAKEARKNAKRAHKQATASAKRAYDAIKFSTPGKLGFMRFVQIIYAVNIATTLFTLIMTSRDVIVYDSLTIIDWISIILQGVAFWFFINYYKVARPFVIVTAAFGIIAPALSSMATGSFSFGSTLTGSLYNIFLIIYFIFSKRVKAVLVNDFSSFRPQLTTAGAPMSRKGWPLVRNLIIYFIVFSVLGHWMEAGMCQFIRLGWVQGEYDPSNTMLWRDWLYPYPMEGAAVVIIALVLYPLWQWLLKKFSSKPIIAYVTSFVINALTCGLIEFTMGLIVNADLQLWDYRENFGNIMGQVCLQNVAAFGVAASLIAWVVYPLMERWLARIPDDTMNIVFVVIAIIGGILWSLYIIDPPENHVYTPEDPIAAIPEENMAMLEDAASLTLLNVQLQEKLDSSKTFTDEQRSQLQEQITQIEKGSIELVHLLSGES